MMRADLSLRLQKHRLRLRPIQGFIVARLRNSDTALLLWSALAGAAAGIGVVLMRLGIYPVRAVLFDIPVTAHLSGIGHIPAWRIVLVPAIGGIGIGLFARFLRRISPREVVDAIEANALYGGRMSTKDSLGLAISTMLSGAVGASVGQEAGFTQLGAALASKLGTLLRLRRDDVRTLVACGAAGGIAAAFNAPLAGAFYAFELILGSYSPSYLGAVAVAALSGTATGRLLIGTEPFFEVSNPVDLSRTDYVAFFLLGLVGACICIAVMRGVTQTEQLFRRNAIPSWLRPGVGGLVLGLIALAYPQVLGAGHGAILQQGTGHAGLLTLLGLLVAKALASAVSIGSGFRGGLFSSSLFLGAVFGHLVAVLMAAMGFVVDPTAYILVGMATVAAGIVGAPVAMILLILEVTSDFSAAIGVTVGVITASFAVRQWFGYSFATWRFHVRGMSIASPEDIGWINDLTVGRLMERNPVTVLGTLSIPQMIKRMPPGHLRHTVAVDDGGSLLGMIDLPELLDPGFDAGSVKTVRDAVHHSGIFLLPQENLKLALQRFRDTAVETLPVVNNEAERRVIGELSEAYALRRYAQELERRRGLETDTAGIFSPAAKV